MFAALKVATGLVIGEYLSRHRASEFVTFLDAIDHTVPAGVDIHVIPDNYATHNHATVTRQLGQRPGSDPTSPSPTRHG